MSDEADAACTKSPRIQRDYLTVAISRPPSTKGTRALLAFLAMLLLAPIAGEQQMQLHQDEGGGSEKTTTASPVCGGHLTSRRGIISTPNFPSAFAVPMNCRWILDSSVLADASAFSMNNSIIVYLSQLYVYRGLSFTEYAYYESESVSFGAASLEVINEGNVFELGWIRTFRPYLVVEFHLDRLEGNHVRVLDKLLDVYGFNLTYEIIEGQENPTSCSLKGCSFAGNCLLASDYATFYCDCFEGFGGEHCGHGPLCVTERGNPICQNGGTCRHVGAAAVRCLCTPRFSGDFCEISSDRDKEDACPDCIYQCPFPGDSHQQQQQPCQCKKPIRVHSDRTRFECRIKLTNVTHSRGVDFIGRSNVSLESQLSKQLAKYAKDSKISSMEDLKILSVTPALEVNFHFFGESRDGDKIRSSLNRLVQHRRLGEFFLEPSHFTFQQKPALRLQTLRIHQASDGRVRVGDQFTLSCEAVGSSDLRFTWYKDDALVNMSKATREIWYRHLPNDGSDYHTSILTVDKSTRLDEGRYTCQVVDWGVQQCKNFHVDIIDDPIVRITPMSATIEKESTVRLMCTTPNMRSVGIGFGWTKNRALLKLEPGHEVWEDLYPAGSILTINHARSSAVYTCNVAHHSASVRLEVVNSSLVPVCPKNFAWGLDWPLTAPGSKAVLDCPQGHRGPGYVTRLCAMRDADNSEWDVPDFSRCLYEPLVQPYEDFIRVTLGYEVSNGSWTIQSYWEVLQYRRTLLYPGEGDRIISLLQEVENYQRNIDELGELRNSAEAFMRIVDRIIANGHSILTQEKLLSLSQLVIRNLGYWNEDSAHKHLSLPELVVDVVPLTLFSSTMVMYGSKVPQQDNQNKYPDWYNERVTIRSYHNRLHNPNKTISGIVVVYRDLAQFFPSTYITELEDGSDMEYRISSRVISVSTPSHWGPADRDERLSIELEFAGARDSTRSWNASCGILGPSGDWNLDSCTPSTAEANVLEDGTAVHCLCTTAGTFAAFLTARSESVTMEKNYLRRNFVVILGCASCLLMCFVSMCVLTAYWWRNRSWLNFLKIQCCLAVMAAMTTFIYALCVHISKDNLSIVAISLEAFLLIGTSSPISQALIMYAELSNIHPSQQFQPTVVAVITGVPILAILTTELTRKTIGWKHESWWLVYNTRVYYIFVICSITMMLTFILLYIAILHKTKPLLYKFTKKDVILLRIRMLHRSAIVIFGIVAMEVSSILYVNSPSIIYQYLFSIQSTLLGFIIIVMYVISGEVLVVTPVFNKLKRQAMADDDSAYERAKARSKERELERELSSTSSVTQLPATLLLTGVCDPSVAAGIYPGETRGVAAGIDARDYMNEAAANAYAAASRCRGLAAGAPEIQIHHVDEPGYARHSPRKQVRICEEPTAYVQASTNFCTDSYHHPVAGIEITQQPYKELVTLTALHPMPTSCPTSILCNSQVETCLGPLPSMPDVTLAINGDSDMVNKSPIIVSAPCNLPPGCTLTEQTYVLCKEPPVPVVVVPDIMEQRKQPDGEDVKPIVRRCDVILEDVEPIITSPATNGMLDRISHDLDYLLNRTKEE